MAETIRSRQPDPYGLRKNTLTESDAWDPTAAGSLPSKPRERLSEIDPKMQGGPKINFQSRMLTQPEDIFGSPYTEGGEYQRGGPVTPNREPTHVTHNRNNRRMIAHYAQRNLPLAAHLLQGLRRQHNGFRALAVAALAKSHGLRTATGRHELAHGHDAHALHLSNIAHSKVPDGAEVHFSQHGDHDFNVRVKRGNRVHDFPLTRDQLAQFHIGPAGGFDHSLAKGVENNLALLSRHRAQPPGYQGGGEVQSGMDVAADQPI